MVASEEQKMVRRGGWSTAIFKTGLIKLFDSLNVHVLLRYKIKTKFKETTRDFSSEKSPLGHSPPLQSITTALSYLISRQPLPNTTTASTNQDTKRGKADTG